MNNTVTLLCVNNDGISGIKLGAIYFGVESSDGDGYYLNGDEFNGAWYLKERFKEIDIND